MGYPKKYIWGSVLLENELRKIRERIKKETDLSINVSDISHKLGEDLRRGSIRIEIPTIRFRKGNFIKIENEIKKIKKKS